MIRVLKQKERIPNVVRCLGSPIHKYGGLLGVVVLFVGFSICLWVRRRMGPTNCYEERGIIHGYETDDKQFV